MPHLGRIGHSTDHIFISLWVWSTRSKAQAIMENRLGKMHIPLNISDEQVGPSANIPLSQLRGHLHKAPPSSACIKDSLCFLYVPMTSSFLPSPLALNGPSHRADLFDATVCSGPSVDHSQHTSPALPARVPRRRHCWPPSSSRMSPLPSFALLILGADSAARAAPCGSSRETVINPALFSGSFRRSWAQTRLLFLKGHKI